MHRRAHLRRSLRTRFFPAKSRRKTAEKILIYLEHMLILLSVVLMGSRSRIGRKSVSNRVVVRVRAPITTMTAHKSLSNIFSSCLPFLRSNFFVRCETTSIHPEPTPSVRYSWICTVPYNYMGFSMEATHFSVLYVIIFRSILSFYINGRLLLMYNWSSRKGEGVVSLYLRSKKYT